MPSFRKTFLVVKEGKHRLVGFVELGNGHDLMESLSGMFKSYTLNKQLVIYLLKRTSE